MVVQHNLSAMNANRMLGITQGTLSKSTEKLSSGYKINRAADDAAGLSISEKMRKQIRGLTQASLNAEDGISAVQTAEGALSEVQDMLQRMNELAVKGSNGTLSESDRQDIQNEIDNLVTEIDRVSETTKFNETYLLKGDNTVDNKVTYDYTQKLYLADKTLYDANGTEVAKGTVLDNNATYYTSRTATGKEALTLQADKDNPLLTATKVSFDKDVYSRDEDGNVTFIASGKAVNVGTTIYGNAANIFKAVQYTPTAGTEVTTDEFGAYATDSQLMDKDGNEVAANGLYSYFDENGTYKGGLYKYADSENPSIKNLTEMSAADVNLMVEKTEKETGALTLTLHVGADATKNNQISVDIDAMSASSLGIEGLEMTGKDDTKALNAIETIKAALQQVSEQRSALGAVQNRLEHTIKNLDNVVENTTAAESQIRDTDMASEMVKYSNANILSQAGQSMLAQANQSNQGVLSILG